jgi:DNA-directed RNA polymerase subunit M/transcription elongation factor TFIIS
MHFCLKCDNMYYLKLKEDDVNKLIYYCRHCGHEATELHEDDICILKTQIKRYDEKYTHVVNEYTKSDPTLPRIKTIKCPNQECLGILEGKENEIIYIRYDDENIKYIYMCAHCDTTWKTSDQ